MEKKTIAVVTGASSGMGKEFVKLLLWEKVDEIFILARSEEKLLSLREEMGERIRVFPIDLSDRKAIEAFRQTLSEEKASIRYLVNNAGFGKFGSHRDISFYDNANMVDLNCTAVVLMTEICLPYMEKGSRIVNLASLSAFQPVPYLNLYAATKAFVRNYSRGLNEELKEDGITVTAVCPGWVDTAFFDRAKTDSPQAPTHFRPMAKADQVAFRALSDAKKGKPLSVYGWYPKLCHLLSKMFPQAWMMKLWRIWQGL